MKKVLLVIIILLSCLFSNYVLAQSAGLNFALGFPQGEFENNVKRTGFGGSGQFLLFTPTVKYPFSLGLNLGFINYGSESRAEPFSMTIPDVIVEVDRSNNIFNFHFLMQVVLPEGIVRPYAEALFGGAYIFTETSVKSHGTEEIASSTNFDDFAWSYGAGGGLLFRVYSSDVPENRVSSVFVDLKIRYLYGSEAEYLKQGSVRVNNGRVTYDVSKSKTDLLTAHLGVVVYFNSLWSNLD